VSNRDPLITLLKELDGPVDPRPEFADALRAQLLEQLAQTNGARARQPIRLPHRVLPARLGRPLLAGVALVALAAIVIAVVVVVVSRPAPASALDVIRQARAAFAHMPAFQATYKVELNPDGTYPNQPPKGATATVVVSYGGPDRFRTQTLAEHLIPLTQTATPPGSYQVFNGRTYAIYNSLWKRFDSYPSTGVPALEGLSWHGAYPDWERVCAGPNSKVLADAQIAGRDARHIRCVNFTGEVWELWIDRQTGLLLKVIGQVGGDDFFLGGIGTSAKGGYTIEKLRYNPRFPAGTFSVKPPPGTFDIRAAQAKVPPFRAVIYSRGYHADSPGYRCGRCLRQRRGSSSTELVWHLVSSTEAVWHLNSHTWRQKTLSGTGVQASSVGDFSVSGPGGQVTYDAHDKTYYRGSTVYSPETDPAQQLLPADEIYSVTHTECPVVGHGRVAGRDAVHRHCPAWGSPIGVPIPSSDIWADSATGLMLKYDTHGSKRDGGGAETRVLSIVYSPSFPPGTFRFVPPPGSVSGQRISQLANSPYYKTKLAPGKPAPNWHATTLTGKPFQLTDLRGKPALILVLAGWCTDPACDELTPLEHAYQKSNHKTQVIWVEIRGNAPQTKKIARLNHVTFTVVIDTGNPGAVIKAWATQGVPSFVLLDSRGRVIEAHFHQTAAQLTTMLGEHRAPH
jgi:outer membrane lipoprotein-sorting protein